MDATHAGQVIYLALTVVAIAINLFVAILTFGRRDQRGAIAGMSVALSLSGWLTAVLMMSVSPTEVAPVWENVRRIFSSAAPWFAFWGAVDLAGYRPARRRLLQAASAIPLLARCMLIWPLSAHAHHFAVLSYERIGWLTYEVSSVHGPLYLPYVIYTYGLGLASVLVFAHWISNSGRLAANQGVLLAAAVICGVGAHLAKTSGLVQGTTNWIPLGLTLSGLLSTVAIFRHRTLALSPISRHALFDALDSGVLALDASGRIVDLNPAMERMCGVPASQAFGRRFADLLAPDGDLALRMVARQHGIVLEYAGRHYAVQRVDIAGSSGRATGQLYVFTDDTARQHGERERDRLIAAHRDDALRRYARRTEQASRGAELSSGGAARGRAAP